MPNARVRPNETSAGGVVVRLREGDAGEVCLVNDGRYWGLPKGNVERGETSEQAALREISEETGIAAGQLRLLAPLTASEYVYRRGGRLIFKRVDFFLVTVPAGTELHPQPEEIAEARWVSFAEARVLASFKDTVRSLDESERLLAAPGVATV